MTMPGFNAETSLPDLTARYARFGILPATAREFVRRAVSADAASGVGPALRYACHLVCDDFVCTVVCGPILAPPPDLSR
jgi:hypothetical protein